MLELQCANERLGGTDLDNWRNASLTLERDGYLSNPKHRD